MSLVGEAAAGTAGCSPVGFGTLLASEVPAVSVAEAAGTREAS